MTKKPILRCTVILMSSLILLSAPSSSAAFAEDPPLVLAFYYSWYDQNTWTSGSTTDQPAQPYTSSDPAAIERHVGQAQAAGIDALVQSWYGPQETDNQTETNFRTLLGVAAVKGFRAAVDFETTSPFFTDQGQVGDALRYLLTTHVKHSAYLRHMGKPVIFFWRQQRFSVEEWAVIRAQVDPNYDSLWIAEGVDIAYQAVFDGHHLYSVAWSPDVTRTLSDWGYRVRRYEAQNETNRLWIATVMPGYNDTRTNRADAFAVDRQRGDYYRQTWSAAIASQPDWIIVTSFNEWVEGTMIEPSVSYGDLYLNLTRELAMAFRSGNEGLEPKPKEDATLNQASAAGSPVLEDNPPAEPYIRANVAVRVRGGPGTNFPRLGRLSPGETARVVGTNADRSWWQIDLSGTSAEPGWVTAEFVTLVGNLAAVPFTSRATPGSTELPSPTTAVTPTPSPTLTPSLTSSTRPSSSSQQAGWLVTPAPAGTQVPGPTAIPTFTPTPSSSRISPSTPTGTPVLRPSPTVQPRPLGLLWIGSSALALGVVLSIVLLRAARDIREL